MGRALCNLCVLRAVFNTPGAEAVIWEAILPKVRGTVAERRLVAV